MVNDNCSLAVLNLGFGWEVKPVSPDDDERVFCTILSSYQRATNSVAQLCTSLLLAPSISPPIYIPAVPSHQTQFDDAFDIRVFRVRVRNSEFCPRSRCPCVLRSSFELS